MSTFIALGLVLSYLVDWMNRPKTTYFVCSWMQSLNSVNQYILVLTTWHFEANLYCEPFYRKCVRLS